MIIDIDIDMSLYIYIHIYTYIYEGVTSGSSLFQSGARFMGLVHASSSCAIFITIYLSIYLYVYIYIYTESSR